MPHFLFRVLVVFLFSFWCYIYFFFFRCKVLVLVCMYLCVSFESQNAAIRAGVSFSCKKKILRSVTGGGLAKQKKKSNEFEFFG